MPRRAILAVACLVAFATTTAPARAAAPSNGMLAAVVDGKVVTLNPDGSGLRTVWTPTSPGDISGLSWSPDGAKLAFSLGGKIFVISDLLTGRPVQLPNNGTQDLDPAWSPSSAQITFRRGDGTVTMSLDGSERGTTRLEMTSDAFAWAPDSTPEKPHTAWTVRTSLYNSDFGKLNPDFPRLEMRRDAVGTPAWSPDSKRLAYAASGSGAGEPGLYSDRADGSRPMFVTVAPVGPPRWSPDGGSLIYVVNGALRTVPAADLSTPAAVPGVTGATVVDWQSCVPGASFADCVSVAPPTCEGTSLTATTQSDQAVDLPAHSCKDPASRGLSVVLVKGPDHGMLAGQRYTPAAGFVGQDELAYKLSNGFGESPVVTVKIFVVKRAGSPPPPPIAAPVVRAAPYLTARATPRLDRRRTALVRLGCDQNCSFEVRLTGTLKRGKK